MAFLGPTGAIRPSQAQSSYKAPTRTASLKSKVLARRAKPVPTAQKNANTLGQVVRGAK